MDKEKKPEPADSPKKVVTQPLRPRKRPSARGKGCPVKPYKKSIDFFVEERIRSNPEKDPDDVGTSARKEWETLPLAERRKFMELEFQDSQRFWKELNKYEKERDELIDLCERLFTKRPKKE